VLSIHPFVGGVLATDGEKRGKERAKGSSDGRRGRSQLSALPCGEGSGGVQGANQFCAVCAGRLGCLFDKPYTCNLADRRLFNKHQTYDLIDRRLFDKPRTHALINRCLFDKHQTCDLADRFLFDKSQTCTLIDGRLFDKYRICALTDRRLFDKYQTCTLIDRRLFACGEAARSVSRDCLIAGIRERVGQHRRWLATGRLYGEGGTFGAGKETLSLLSL